MEKYIVFDWDGTLHNTKKLYGESVRKAYDFLVQQEIARPHYYSDEDLTKYLGMTAADMWADFMPGLEESIRKQAENIVTEFMVDFVYEHKAVLYEGVGQMLDNLKEGGYNLIILSNCKVSYLEAHKKVFELDKWFMDYYPAQQYSFIPKEKILAMIMEKYPGEYVMIGDRAIDIKAGKNNGVKTIGCLYGFGSSEELSDADILVSNILEIYEKAIPFVFSAERSINSMTF